VAGLIASRASTKHLTRLKNGSRDGLGVRLAANFQRQAKGKVVAGSEQDRYIIRSLHVKGLDKSDTHEM
jgi:hypothetical protein